jgi:hypothetical protein
MGIPETIPIFGMVTGILISLAFFTMIVLSISFYFKARNRERMALIEKGADLSKFYKKPDGHSLLKNGMFFIGLAVGLLVAYLLTVTTSMNGVVAYFSMVFLFGGLSLILYYPISAKFLKKRADGK